MNHARRSTALTLTALAALAAATLPARPARAQTPPPYGLFTIGNVVGAAPGGSGSFDILLSAAGGNMSVGSFTAEPTLSAPGITFTAANFSTGTPYVFADSFDRDNGLTLSDEADDPFPNTDLIASDSDNQSGSAVTIASGATVGLAHVTYRFGATDAPGSVYTVNFNPDGTSLSDGAGTVSYPFTTAPGALTVGATAAPEPPGLVSLGLTSLFTAVLMLRARRRRLVEAEQTPA